jgi:hypothetical protein
MVRCERTGHEGLSENPRNPHFLCRRPAPWPICSESPGGLGFSTKGLAGFTVANFHCRGHLFAPAGLTQNLCNHLKQFFALDRFGNEPVAADI